MVVSTVAPDLVPAIPFSESDSVIRFRLWSPKPAGTPVLVKVEAAGGAFAEVTVMTTVSGAWETVVADFAGVANPAVAYNKLAVFPDFGTVGGGEVYYLDDVTFP